MKTKRKSLLKRTLALLLTICSLLAVMVPAVSAEEAAGTEKPVVDYEQVTGPVYGRFDFNESCFGAVSVVNGHDYLFIPHHKTLFVYDLDEWKKVDEEPIGMGMGYGCFVDSNGIVWAYGSTDKMYRYDPVTGEGTWTSSFETEGSGEIEDIIEVNGKFYLGTYSLAELVEYDPATDTFINLGRLSEEARACRVHSLEHKDGYLYATVTSSKAGTAPWVVVKYDLANKKIVETLDINDKTKYHNDQKIRSSALVGNMMFTGSRNPVGMFAIDISGETMRIVTAEELGHGEVGRGVQVGISEVIVEKDAAGNVINEKVYFMSGPRKSVEPMGWTSDSYIYEYNSSTGKITQVEAFKDLERTPVWPHTLDGCIVTVGKEITGIEGWEGPSIVTFDSTGLVYLFNFASGKVWTDATLTAGDGSGESVLCIEPGPEGANTLAFGNGTVNELSLYDMKTGEYKRYPTHTGQVCHIHYTPDGKCYAIGYSSVTLSEVNLETGEATVLFKLNDTTEHNYAFLQERPYNLTSGDGKLFATTAAQKGLLGGYLLWYDLETKTTYMAIESDKVIYLKDSDKTTWFDAKTNEAVVFAHTDGTRNFAGLVADQIPKSIVYQDGYIYGGTSIDGGSGAIRKEGESAVLFAYDVANMKLVTLDVRKAIEGLPEIVDNIYAVAADPAVPGKFWGQVAGTLFSFTYDKATETFTVKEELSISKSNCYLFNNVWTGFPMVIEDGFIIADLRDEAALEAGNRQFRMISTEDPTYNVLLVESGEKHFALGEDNNIYVVTPADNGLGRYLTANRIAEIKANKSARDAVQEKINAIGEVTLESEEAIVAARAAYDALPEEIKAVVSNLDVMTAAEAKYAELKAAAEKAAADKAAADAVTAKIEAIGEVTLESEEDIKAARAAYDALTEEQKKLVDTTALTAAEAKYAELKAAAEKAAADKAAADAAAAKIEAIGEVTLESEEDIKAARAAYDALTDDQKALVDAAKLTAAEAKLSELKAAAEKAAADKAAADAVAAKIEAIGEVTLESEEDIKAARAAYDALTEDQKKLVDTTALTAAEAKYAELKAAAEKAAADKAAADAVAAKIEAIGAVALESEEEIKAARAAYDALTEDQKKLVDTTALTAAEAKYAELKAAAADAARIEAAQDAVGKALAAMTVTNDVSKEAIQKTVDEALKKAGITDATASVTNVAVTAATTEKTGSATITVVIASGKGSETTTHTKTIAKLIPPADPENPKTGDETDLLLPFLLMIVSVMGIAVAVLCAKKLSYKGKHVK